MVNRFGRGPGEITPFKPKGALPDGLPAVQRGAGQEAEALFQVGGQLADVFGREADRQAAIEGKREGAAAGNDPNWRPSGSTGIKGAAFDQAAMSTYLDNLDARMRRQMLETYETNKDNPAALKGAFDALRQDLFDQNVAGIPEIHGQFNASFERLRLPFQVKASDALETRNQDQARAAALEANTATDAVVARAVESRPYDPQTQAVVRAELDQAAARDRALVKSGAMTATQAATNKIARERGAATREAIAAIDALPSVSDVDKAEEAYRKKKADGSLGAAGNDAKAMDEIEAGFARKRQSLQTVARQAGATVGKQAEDMLSRAQEGAMPPVDEVARFRAIASAAPNGAALVEQFDRRLSWIRTATTDGPDGVDRRVRELRKVNGPAPTKEQAEDVQFLDDLSAKLRKATVEDPIGLADKQRVAPVLPIDVDNPAALREGVAAREVLARSLPAEINPNRKMLRPEEVKAIERKIAMGGEAAVDTVQALVSGAGREAPRLMRELGGTAPELAQAGMLLASGGSRQAARDIIAAVAARNLEGGQKPMEVDIQAFRAVWVEKIGNALVYNSQDSQRIERAARAIAMTRLRTLGSNKDSAAKDIYGQAIEEAFGGQMLDGKRVGGIGRVKTGWFSSAAVPLPPEVRPDRFVDALAAIRDDDLPALAVPPIAGTRAAQIRNARPVAVPGGYRFALGDLAGSDPKFIQGQDGKPFVLHWDEVKGRLRERAPGAFLGAR
jgi:hypothetical protein